MFKSTFGHGYGQTTHLYWRETEISSVYGPKNQPSELHICGCFISVFFKPIKTIDFFATSALDDEQSPKLQTALDSKLTFHTSLSSAKGSNLETRESNMDLTRCEQHLPSVSKIQHTLA